MTTLFPVSQQGTGNKIYWETEVGDGMGYWRRDRITLHACLTPLRMRIVLLSFQASQYSVYIATYSAYLQNGDPFTLSLVMNTNVVYRLACSGYVNIIRGT